MVENSIVEGVRLAESNFTKCKACVYGKSTRAPILRSGTTRANRVLDLVHTDVRDPFSVESMGGSRYFLSFVDDYSRYCWTYPIKSKADVFELFQIVCLLLKTYTKPNLRHYTLKGYLKSGFLMRNVVKL